MESPKTPETLEAKNPDLGLLEEVSETLEAKNPDLELLEEVSEAPDLLTLSESSNGLGFILDAQLQVNGNAVGRNSLAMDVKENGVIFVETEECCLVDDSVDEKKEDLMGVLMAGSDERLEVKVDNGNHDNVVVEPVRDEGRKEDDQSGINGVESLNRIQVSGDNISLYVDFSDALNEVNSTSLMVSKDEIRDAGNAEDLIIDGQEHESYVGEVVWVRTKSQNWWPGKILDPSDATEYGLESDQINCRLVGYFGSSHVSWCHPSQLKPFHVNFEQMTGQNKARSFLGAVEKAMDDFGKCLKLEMTCSCVLKENKFLASNSATKVGASTPECKFGELGEFSAAQFEPARFLCQLKNLAQVVSKPAMLEFTAMQSSLSAFYRSIGHCQLPMHQLWGTTSDAENAASSPMSRRDANADLAEESRMLLEQSDVTMNEMSQLYQNGVLAKSAGENWGALLGNSGDFTAGEGVVSSKLALALTSSMRKREKYSEVRCIQFEGPDPGICVSSVENGNNKTEVKNETGFELRERRKSKYLSYPYVNWESKGLSETEDPITLKVSHEGVDEFIGSPSVVKRSAKRFQKKWYRKFIMGNDITAYPELSRRLSSTSSAELLSELHFVAVHCLFPTESKNLDLIEWFFSRFRISAFHDESIYEMYCKKMVNQKETTSTDPCLLGSDLQETKPTFSSFTYPGNKMQKRKKLTNSGTSKIKFPSGPSDVNINFAKCKLSAKEFEAMASEAPYGKQTLAGQQPTRATNIPDLNGNGAAPIPLAEDLQVIGRIASESRKRKRKRAASEHLKTKITPGLLDPNGTNANPSSLLLDLELTGPFSIKTITKESNREGLNVGVPDSSGNNAPPTRPDLGSFASESKPGQKKRGRKPKAPSGHPNPMLTAHIPDLNGSSTELNILGEDLLEANTVLHAVKPVWKRRRRKGEISLSTPNIIVNYDRAEASGKPLGTTLLLTFTPGASMPSKEVLVAMFSSFGPLKESEIQILKDSSSAQVVFTRSEDAGKALQSLEKSNPFGATLMNYHLQNDIFLTTQCMERFRTPAKLSDSISHLGDAPPIDFIRQNLEMMATMLEKSGDNISPEMKVKLETEIKGLLKKVRSWS